LRLIRPVSDVSTGTFTTTPLYSKINESTPDDASKVKSGPGTTDSFEVRFADMSAPSSQTDHIIRYRLRDPSGVVTFTISLVQGSTIIAQWVESSVPTSFVTYERPLTIEQIQAITDYNDLRLRIETRKD
jgi:hypothetical protein